MSKERGPDAAFNIAFVVPQEQPQQLSYPTIMAIATTFVMTIGPTTLQLLSTFQLEM
jgi:hypothetical protein